MDDPQKTQREKRIVAGLLGVLLIVALLGLRGLGMIRPTPRPASSDQGRTASVTSVDMPQGLPSAWQRRIQSQVEEVEQVSKETIAEATATGASNVPVYTASNLRDPLRHLFPAEPAPATPTKAPVALAKPSGKPAPSLVIQGLLWGGPNPQVIINDEVYGVGDLVNGMTIQSIDHHGMTVEYNGQTMVLGGS